MINWSEGYNRRCLVHRQPIFVIPSFVNLWWWWCWQYDTRWQCWAPPKMRCHQPITLVSPISASVWSSLPPNIHLCHITATVSTSLLFSLLNIVHCVSSPRSISSGQPGSQLVGVRSEHLPYLRCHQPQLKIEFWVEMTCDVTTCFDSCYLQTLDTWHCVSRGHCVALDNN